MILKTVIYCTATSVTSMLRLKKVMKANAEYAENCGNSVCDSIIIMDNMAKTQQKSTFL